MLDLLLRKLTELVFFLNHRRGLGITRKYNRFLDSLQKDRTRIASVSATTHALVQRNMQRHEQKADAIMAEATERVEKSETRTSTRNAPLIGHEVESNRALARVDKLMAILEEDDSPDVVDATFTVLPDEEPVTVIQKEEE